jgi:hypothetical protein
MKIWKRTALIAATLGIAVGLCLAFAPFLYAELQFINPSWTPWPPELVSTIPKPGPAAGDVIDGYWQVQKIAPETYAIGEPQGQLDNYEYLLIGKERGRPAAGVLAGRHSDLRRPLLP